MKETEPAEMAMATMILELVAEEQSELLVSATTVTFLNRMFPEESNEIEKYVGGLPDLIHGSVMASKPNTMQDAIEFATELMDQKPKDEGDGEEDQGLNIGEEERHVEEEEEDELYRDVNINQEKGLQASLEVEDSHVTLTLTTSQLDVPTPTSVAPLLITTPTITSSTIATITTTTTSQSSILPTTVPSDIIQNLPNFGLLFRFDDRLRSLEVNFSEFRQTNQFAEAVSSIPEIINHYMDQRMTEAVKVAVQIQSDHL
nr:hypothetical protein [Tanacetum cinerariifolium]